MPNLLFKTVGSAIFTIAVFLIFTFCFPYFLLFFTSSAYTSGPSQSLAIGFMALSYFILGALSRAWNRNLISPCVGINIGIIAGVAVRIYMETADYIFSPLAYLFAWSPFSIGVIGFASSVAGLLITNLIVRKYGITTTMGRKLVAVVLIAFITACAGRLYWHMNSPVIPKAWLLRRVNLADVEEPDWITRSDKFGEEWRALKRQMKPGDELWFYERPLCVLCDEGGYALVRKGEPIAKLVIFVS
jgi:hypothetical protein